MTSRNTNGAYLPELALGGDEVERSRRLKVNIASRLLIYVLTEMTCSMWQKLCILRCFISDFTHQLILLFIVWSLRKYHPNHGSHWQKFDEDRHGKLRMRPVLG